MARLTPNDKVAGAAYAGDGSPPSAVKIVLDGIYDWARDRQHQGPMPSPCPPTFEDTARWWIAKMQEPERPGETRKLPGIGDTSRWECGYALRCRNALMQWLAMPEKQRNAVAMIVMEDNVPYRGDSFSFYASIVEETMKMRDDKDGYILAARKLLRSTEEISRMQSKRNA